MWRLWRCLECQGNFLDSTRKVEDVMDVVNFLPLTQPRPHEAGGKFAKDIVVQSYPKGGVIPIEIDVRANHGGYFEFRVCPAPSQRGVEVTEECLDKHVLVGENGKTRYHLGPGNRIFKMNYKLPANMTCARCVLQWKWIASHNPDRCNGEG